MKKAENNEGKESIVLVFLGKHLVFLCKGNDVNVNSDNTIIPPEHILCHSEIYV